MPAEAVMPSHPAQIRCPTCGLTQDWTGTCRRCRCDLGLLQAALAEYERNRCECLRLLYAGFGTEALGHAQRCLELKPGDEPRRLIALCLLLEEHYDAAVAVAQWIGT